MTWIPWQRRQKRSPEERRQVDRGPPSNEPGRNLTGVIGFISTVPTAAGPSAPAGMQILELCRRGKKTHFGQGIATVFVTEKIDEHAGEPPSDRKAVLFQAEPYRNAKGASETAPVPGNA